MSTCCRKSPSSRTGLINRAFIRAAIVDFIQFCGQKLYDWDSIKQNLGFRFTQKLSSRLHLAPSRKRPLSRGFYTFLKKWSLLELNFMCVQIQFEGQLHIIQDFVIWKLFIPRPTRGWFQMSTKIYPSKSLYFERHFDWLTLFASRIVLWHLFNLRPTKKLVSD